MSAIDGCAGLSRRQLLRRAALLLGTGALGTGALAAGAVSPAVRAAVMAAEQTPDKTIANLTSAQLALVERLSDIIIPTTDTPGAAAAGVHHFIDTISANFAPKHRRAFAAGLADVDERARAAGSDGFLGVADKVQNTIVTALDREAYGSGERQHFFREFKQLTLMGYYTSQDGASRELAYSAIPGEFRGCVPLKEIGRAWATQ